MKKSVKLSILLGIFISLLLFSYFFPYSCDDWGFATNYGLKQLGNFYQDLNGRYLGNIIVTIISRNNIIKTFYMSSVLFFILYFGTKLIKKDNLKLMIIFYILLLGIKIQIFAEGIVWSSGFANYATSTLMIILILYFLKNPLKFKYSIIIYFLLSFVSSFLVENITVGLFCFSVLINIYYYFKNKKLNYRYLALLLGSITGSILMFLNPSYLKLFNHTDNYRHLRRSHYKISIFPNLFENYLFNFFKMFIVLLICFKNNKGKINYLAGFLFNLAIIAMMNNRIFVDQIIYYPILAFYVLTMLWFFYLNRNLLDKNLLTLIIMLGLILLPLFFVSPVGARNFLSIYVLEGIIYLTLFAKLTNSKYLLVWLFILIGFYSFIFIKYQKDFSLIKNEVNRIIEAVNSGEKEINASRDLLFDYAVHYGLPHSNGEVKKDFSSYYHISNDWKINFYKKI